MHYKWFAEENGSIGRSLRNCITPQRSRPLGNQEVKMKQKPARRIFLREFKAISHAILTYEDFKLLPDNLAEHLCRTFSLKGCSIMLCDDRAHQLFRVGNYGLSMEYLGKGPLFSNGEDGKEDCDCTYGLKGEPLFIEDVRNHPLVQYPEHAVREGIVSILNIPITCHEGVFGIIRIYSGESLSLDQDDLDSLCLLARQLGMVIQNNGLKNFLDSVTTSMSVLPRRLFSDSSRIGTGESDKQSGDH